MDVGNISVLAFAGVGLALLIGFEIVERYDSQQLITLLIDPTQPTWATWLLNVAAALFAQRCALRAMGFVTERQLRAAAESGTLA